MKFKKVLFNSLRINFFCSNIKKREISNKNKYEINLKNIHYLAVRNYFLLCLNNCLTFLFHHCKTPYLACIKFELIFFL